MKPSVRQVVRALVVLGTRVLKRSPTLPPAKSVARLTAVPFAVGALSGSPALADDVWDDPMSFARMTTAACTTAASIPEKADRIAFLEQQYAMTPTGAAPDAGEPDLIAGPDITAGWEPAAAPSIFCATSAPGSLYDADGVAKILGWLSQGAEVPLIAEGMYGPIQRKMMDGRTIVYALIYDPSDTLIVTGQIK